MTFCFMCGSYWKISPLFGEARKLAQKFPNWVRLSADTPSSWVNYERKLAQKLPNWVRLSADTPSSWVNYDVCSRGMFPIGT